MRGLFLALLVFGCSKEGLPSQSYDLANADFSRPASSMDLAGVDLSGPPEMCVSTCNRCAGGGCCGVLCCNEGEWCDATNTCRCGSALGCTAGLICARGGPAGPGLCGFTCCGDAQHPCPL